MSDPMRVRATESGGVVDVKILMKHDMETGQRKCGDLVGCHAGESAAQAQLRALYASESDSEKMKDKKKIL